MRKRSKYRPKGVRLDPIRYILEGMKPMSQHPAVLDLRIKNHGAMTAVVKGTATRDDIDVLISALNMAEALVLVNPDLGSDWRGEISAAQDALYTMARRGADKNRFLFTGPEMKAMNTAMDIHDAQIDKATVAQLEQAIDIVTKTIMHRKARPIVEKGTTP